MLLRGVWRLACFALIGFSVIWAGASVATLPPPALFGMALGLRQGGNYEPTAVRAVLAQTSATDCRVETRRSALILSMRMLDGENRAEPAVAAEGPSGRHLAGTREAALAVLACAPSDGLGWLALYLTSIRQSGFGPKAVAELRNAYRNAPHEAWLQILRLPAVLLAYPSLPPFLQEGAITDFDELLSANLHGAVAAIIMGSPRSIRETLLAKLCFVPRDQQMIIARELDHGRSDIEHRCLPDLSRPAYIR